MNKRKIEDLTRFNNIGLPLEKTENNWVFYCVSLDRLTERRVEIIEQLLPFIGKLPIFIYDAIDWKDYSLEEMKSEGFYPYENWKISENVSYSNKWYNEKLKLGDLGCCISHYNVWNHIKQTGFKYSLILEDDAIFELETFIEGLNLANDFLENNDCDIFYLDSSSHWENERVAEHIERCGYEYCTHAYAVTQNAVNELLGSGIKQNFISPDEFLSSTFCDHPREDLRNLYNNRKLKAYKLNHDIEREEYYIRQSISHVVGASNYGISEIVSSIEIE